MEPLRECQHLYSAIIHMVHCAGGRPAKFDNHFYECDISKDFQVLLLYKNPDINRKDIVRTQLCHIVMVF